MAVAPKETRFAGTGSGKGKRPAKPGTDAAQEDVLQAVLLADSFQDLFWPFTLERPRCLLPLANTPLIEYTLEFLAMNAVRQVFVYAGAQVAQVEEYLAKTRWASTRSPFERLEVVPLRGATSIGDVLRDLDKRGLVEGDFLVVHADLVSNLRLEPALAAHRARREANAQAVMTLLLREAGTAPHRTRPRGHGDAPVPVFAIDADSGRCLHYDELHRPLVLDPAVPSGLSAGFDLRSDLIDPGIDICTPDVLALWSETFDYELPRRHFMHGVLRDWELNGKLFYTHLVPAGYAARASSLALYEAVTRDVLARWTFPFVPDCNLAPDQTYSITDADIYLEEAVELARNCTVTASVIATRTTVAAGAVISRSVIGRGCVIGADAVIEDSVLWNNVTVGSGAVVRRSIIADGARIGARSCIPAGSLISFNVRISDGVSFADPVVLSTVSPDGSAQVKTDTALLGPDGRGAAFVHLSYPDLDPDDPLSSSGRPPHHLYTPLRRSASASSCSSLASYASSGDHAASPSASRSSPAAAARAAGSSPPGSPAMLSASRQRQGSYLSDDVASGSGSGGPRSFHREAVVGLVEALRDDAGDDLGPARLEFMGLRLACNASEAAVQRAIADALARRAAELLSTGLEPPRAAERALMTRPGTARFIADIAVGAASHQPAFALVLQRAIVAVAAAGSLAPARAGTLLAALLQQLYVADVLEEDGILAWYADPAAVGTEALGLARGRCAALVEWLQEAEGEDDEEDDDGEEDEDD